MAMSTVRDFAQNVKVSIVTIAAVLLMLTRAGNINPIICIVHIAVTTGTKRMLSLLAISGESPDIAGKLINQPKTKGKML